jgi:DNA-binding beta-propeller fold protein YncE
MAGVIAGIAFASVAGAAPAHQRAFVPQQLLNGVAVINADTNTVETSNFLSGFTVPRTAAVSPDGSIVLITDSSAASVKIYDTDTLALLANITGITDAWGIDVSPDGSEAYVVGRTPAAAASMRVIDLLPGGTQYTVVATVPTLGTQAVQRYVTAGPAATTRYVYVTNHDADTIWAIKRSDLTKTAITVGDGPCAAALDTPGKRLFVVNRLSSTVSVVDVNEANATFNTVIGTVTLTAGIDPRSISVHPKGTFAYVGANASTSIHVFDMATYALKTPIPAVSANSAGVAVDPDGTRIYAFHPGNDRISVISAYTRSFLQIVSSGTGFLDFPASYSPKAFTPPFTDPAVEGTVSANIDLRTITCKNDTQGFNSGQKAITGHTWSCDALGMPSTKGDTIRITLTARANAAGPSISTIEGLVIDALRVTNTTLATQGECNRATSCLPWSETPVQWETLHSQAGGTGTGFTVAPTQNITVGIWAVRN